MAAVGNPERTTGPEATLGEVEPVTHTAPDAVVRGPPDQRGVDAALENEVLDEPAYFVVREWGDACRPLAKASPQAPSDVVLSTALPGHERPCRTDTPVTRVKAQHDLSQGDFIET